MTAQNIGKYILCVALGIILAGCAQEMDTSFQKLKADPKVKLFQVFDETPAIKSMFDNIDQDEFNQKANDLQNSNPELIAQLYLNLGYSFYGDNAPMPLMVSSMAEGLSSFHSVYSQNPEALDTTLDIAGDILRLDSQVMMDGVGSISDLLVKLRNWNDENNNEKIEDNERDYYWDLFGPNQELSDIGYDGINLLLENLEFVYDLYDGAKNLDDPKILAQNFFQTIVDSNKDVETSIADVIDYLENPEPGESVQDIEEEVADWMVADEVKARFMGYVINQLYPIMANPVLNNAQVPDNMGDPELGLPSYITTEDDYKNFVKRGRWLLEEQAKIFSATAMGLFTKSGQVSPNTEESKTLLTQWLVDSFSQDIQLWDSLESIQIFDFTNNSLLKWLGSENSSDGFYSISERLKASLELTSDTSATGRITRKRVKDLLWNNWTYTPQNGGATTTFKGIFYIDPSYVPPTPYVPANDPSGYVAKMSRTKSSDLVGKPYRRQVHDILNGTKNGDYTDDGDPLGDNAYKRINLSYGQGSESQMEALMTNIQLYLLSEFFCTEDMGGDPVRKWALTPEDGQAYFGDNKRNLQTYVGNMLTSLRNLVVLDRNGKDPSIDPSTGNPVDASAERIPMLGELLFVTAAGYGVVDPNVAPAELRLEDCLSSMGSTLGSSDWIDLGLFGQRIHALGNNTIYRWDANATPGNYNDVNSIYATQNNMPAQELLQPGSFRSRRGSERDGTAIVGNWRGKFSSSQGDIRGIVDANQNINTTNWTMTEIALACWEGYGPYTFKGRAPNGSDCKYKSDWYTDWYGIKDDDGIGASDNDRAPGVGHQASLGAWEERPNQSTASYGRYHVYETIYRPKVTDDPGFVESDKYTNSDGTAVTTTGYMRPSGNNDDGVNYHDPNYVVDHGTSVVLDCASREEAIRKNFFWLLNQKKYTYLIPIQGNLEFLWGIIQTELFAFSSINCNGILGVTRAKRHGGNISDNAIWGLRGTNSNRAYKQYVGWFFGNKYVTNYVVDMKTDGEPINTFRFDGVSFDNQDYCVALDYTMYLDGIGSGLTSMLMDMMALVWNCLGGNPVLPPVVGNNFQAMGKVAESVYTQSDLMDNTGNALVDDITKFWKFYRIYYGDAGLFDNDGDLASGVTPKDLPPVPRVNGVSYPDTFAADGTVATWVDYYGPSKGKFEDVLGLLAMAIGTMHEDGIVYTPTGEQASYTDINNGNIGYFAKDGFRANIDTMLTMVCALNDNTKNTESSGTRPGYDPNNIINILVDNNPAYSTIRTEDRGKRLGLLPAVLKSKYLNVNNINPVKEGMELAIRHVIRTYLNSFMLSEGPTSGDLESYSDPMINWNTPINRLRYFMDNNSLDQLKRSLDMLKDLLADDTFLTFLKASIPGLNDYLYIKWIEEQWDGDPAHRNITYAKNNGLLQLNIESEDIDDFKEFLNDFAYADFIDFIKESGLNDIEKLYNFSFDTIMQNASGEDITPYDLYDQIGSLNRMLIQYFSVNLLEGSVLGVYEIQPGATGLPAGLAVGDIVWGYGKYEKFEPVDRDADGTIELTEDSTIPGIITGGDDYNSVADGYVVVNTDENGRKNYFRYLDFGQWIVANRSNATAVEVLFEGLTRYFDFRHDDYMLITETDTDSQYCLDYVSPWFRAGRIDVPVLDNRNYSHVGGYAYTPNVFNLHNYDLRMDWAMQEYDEFLLGLTSLNFEYGNNAPSGWSSIKEYKLGKGVDGTVTYKRPIYNSGSDEHFSAVNWLFGWNGTSYGGLKIIDELNFAKDYAIDHVFDEVEVSLSPSITDLLNYQKGDFFDIDVDPLDVAYWIDTNDDEIPDQFDEKYSTTRVRKLVQKARDYLNVEVLEYEYAPGLFEEYKTARDLDNNGKIDDLENGHRHSVNNLTEIVADIVSPVDRYNPSMTNVNNVLINSLVNAWLNFAEEAKIDKADLVMVQEAAGNLLWDNSGVQPSDDLRDLTHLKTGYYTHLFSKMSKNAPNMLKQFQGLYGDLVQLGLLAFSEDGLGSYMMDVMSPAEQYDSWDLVEEFNYLINTDIFKSSADRDTFWWQAGNLVEDLAIILLRREERNEAPASMDYYGAVSNLFK